MAKTGRANKKNLSSKVGSKNYSKLQLLVLLPQFKAELEKIRKQFGIPQAGFSTREAADKWLDENNYNYMPVGAEGYGNKPNLFRNEMYSLGKRFHLPMNVYDASYYGMPWYVIVGDNANLAVLGRNWSPLYQGSEPAEWVGVRVFAPLTDEEFKEMKEHIQGEQKSILDPSLNIPTGLKKQFQRDIEIWEYIADRTALPRRKKVYQVGGYLSIVQRQNPKAFEKLKNKREFKKSVSVEYDQPLIKEIAKKLRISPETARQSLRRLNENAEKWFGSRLF